MSMNDFDVYFDEIASCDNYFQYETVDDLSIHTPFDFGKEAIYDYR